MSKVKRKRRGVSTQTFRYSKNLSIRLTYDRATERQSVLLNGELRSAFRCPAGYRAVHTFSGHDGAAEERGYASEWRVLFAVDDGTFRIRYEIGRRNGSGEDTKWYWWDRNAEPGDWGAYPVFEDDGRVEGECENCGTDLRCPRCETQTCGACVSELICPECETATCKQCESCLICFKCQSASPSPRVCARHGELECCPKCDAPACLTCDTELICPTCRISSSLPTVCHGCGDVLSCDRCDERAADPDLVHDVARMQENLALMDASHLQSLLVSIIGKQQNSSVAWTELVDEMLSEAGFDLSAVALSLTANDDDQPVDGVPGRVPKRGEDCSDGDQVD